MAMRSDAAARAWAAETTLARTYRYLRLAIAGTVVAIAVAVVIAAVTGSGVLSSISAYYYTPARDVLVGALVAAATGMLALSGRGIERALLDVAAVLLPLVAFVPTPLAPGQVSGLTFTCPSGEAMCLPPTSIDDVDNAVAAYLVIGAIAVVVALVLGVIAGRAEGLAASGRATLSQTWPSIVIATGILLLVWATWSLARPQFFAFAHVVVTVGFFLLLAAVALVQALRLDHGEQPPPSRVVRIAYIVIAALLVLDLAALLVALGYGANVEGPVLWVLVGEFLALVLFAAFWILQTTHAWDDPDPTLAPV